MAQQQNQQQQNQQGFLPMDDTPNQPFSRVLSPKQPSRRTFSHQPTGPPQQQHCSLQQQGSQQAYGGSTVDLLEAAGRPQLAALNSEIDPQAERLAGQQLHEIEDMSVADADEEDDMVGVGEGEGARRSFGGDDDDEDEVEGCAEDLEIYVASATDKGCQVRQGGAGGECWCYQCAATASLLPPACHRFPVTAYLPPPLLTVYAPLPSTSQVSLPVPRRSTLAKMAGSKRLRGAGESS